VNRREFIMLIGGAAAWPAAARAQQTGKVPTIGLLGSGTAAAQSQWTAAFVTRLREIGWTERRNIAIEYRWAEGRSERFVEIAEEFVRLKVDVIVTHNTLPALAAKQATSAIPIVFATAGDPLGTGIVASLARPGGNITGLSSQHPDATGKRPELLRDLVPVCAGWQSWQMSTIPSAPWTYARFREPQVTSTWKSVRLKFGVSKTSNALSTRSRVAPRHCTSCPIRSCS
jgi:putative tryptophan/tyrosine transport system substrate-binding protein